MRFFSKKKELRVFEPIADVETLMKELEVPTWLQNDVVTVLKSRQKTMSNEELQNWLKQMALTYTHTIPEEFQVEKDLDLCFNTHKDWIENEISVYAELTYEEVDIHLKNLPDSIKKMNRKAQKAYLAISTNILNIFSQIV